MCGIIGYIGKQQATPILIEGLKRLEYRGYDSAGLALIDIKGKIRTIKAVGKMDALESKLSQFTPTGTLGIGHTRWATHGRPSAKNTHPHTDCGKGVYLVHNGIIENYQSLKRELTKKGHSFYSETDTEVLAHLVEEHYNGDLEDAVRKSLNRIDGTYGIAVISKKEPDKIIAARKGSPLLLGVGEGENIIASDASAVVNHTKKVIYLDDNEMATITSSGFKITSLKIPQPLKKEIQQIDWEIEDSQKEGFSHFMLKEINEQPKVVENAMRGRLINQEGLAKLGGLELVEGRLRKINKLIIVACGTAYYAGLVGEYMIEEYAGVPVEVEYASEFRYRKPILDSKTAVLAISQSGETADTLAAIREAKRKGALTIGIVNVVGSTIARETDAGVYNHGGPEIGVASTKAFVSQVVILALLSLFLGRQRQMSQIMGRRIAGELTRIPNYIDRILKSNQQIKKLAKRYSKYNNFLYLGRKYNYPIALEGALKLKEISYAHAEGHSAGEMKHGSIALIGKNFPSIFIAPKDSVYEKMASNMEEVRARDGRVITITTRGNKKISSLADDIIYIPKTLEMLTPILSVVPLQLFAYWMAVFRGCDPDRPRNLAKSVTVE